MPLVPYNSVGGFSTGLTMTNVIDSTGNITGVGATFSGLIRANAGISASGITVGIIVSGGTTGIILQPGSGVLSISGGISASGGFTFGSPSGTTFMVFVPQTSCSNGGLWIRDGNLQIGGSALAGGNGAFAYSPCGEQFTVYGYSTFQNSYNYQAGRAPLRLNGAPTQSVPILAAYKQTSDGTQLTNTFTTTNMVAGIDQNGALFSTVGVCAAGGITFAGTLKGVTASFTGLLSASSGISASGATFNGNVFTDNIFDINGTLNLNNQPNSRVAIGDSDQAANSTHIYLRDNTSVLQLTNPFGTITLGDPAGIDNGNYISYDAPTALFSGNGLNSLDGFQTISADTEILENNRRVTTNARSWFL
jgi:hypothetical protein